MENEFSFHSFSKLELWQHCLSTDATLSSCLMMKKFDQLREIIAKECSSFGCWRTRGFSTRSGDQEGISAALLSTTLAKCQEYQVDRMIPGYQGFRVFHGSSYHFVHLLWWVTYSSSERFSFSPVVLLLDAYIIWPCKQTRACMQIYIW